MALFKYTGLQYIPSCIENGIFASRLDNINDPFEGKGIRYPNRYRVVCLTASPYQMLMWAYYGNHRGCCIEFDVEKVKSVRQVEYIREFLSHEDMNTQEVILLENKEAYDKMSGACNLYGDGHACERIADILEGKEYSPWEPK